MNKRILLLICTLLCVSKCFGVTNMLERARQLFNSERMLNTNVYMDEEKGEYRSFVNNISQFVRDGKPEEVLKLEEYLVSMFTSINVQVSTNEVRQGPELSFLIDRGDAFCSIMLRFREQAINTNLCLDVAHYLGRVKRTPFPEDLAQTRRTATYYNPDPSKMAEWKVKESAWWRKRNHQQRVYNDNSNVDYYRQELLRGCGETLPHCQEIMSSKAFSTFTNEIVSVSNATSEEQKALFRRLKHD